ncbi:MAG: molybdopterin molybdotransferase MoeA [Methanomicrobiales archaeon]|nr:molybdopterin molybdotransferase MoeA [Methanomicrobiales archaeon]
MSLFFSVIPVAEAIRILTSGVAPAGDEEIPLEQGLSRILSGAVSSDSDIPGFTRSVVDGYAVQAADTTGAGDAIPSMLRQTGAVPMGGVPDRSVAPGECLYVPTGAVIPPGADAVVMVEHAETAGDLVLIRRPVAPGENILGRGEDFPRGGVVLPGGRRLRPQDLGVLAAAGKDRIRVYRRPRVGVISTGNELVPVTAIPSASQVRDVNSTLCAGFLQEHGCLPKAYGIVSDEQDLLRAALDRALSECDAVLVSGGSSKDVRDHCAAAIAGGGEVLAHGIALQPGKPTILGRMRGKPVIGLPGHPASAYIVLRALVRPLVGAMSGGLPPERRVPAVLAQNLPSPRGREDWVRVRLEGDQARPVFGKSGLLNTLAASDGVVVVPAEREGMEAGEAVEVILW